MIDIRLEEIHSSSGALSLQNYCNVYAKLCRLNTSFTWLGSKYHHLRLNEWLQFRILIKASDITYTLCTDRILHYFALYLNACVRVCGVLLLWQSVWPARSSTCI